MAIKTTTESAERFSVPTTRRGREFNPRKSRSQSCVSLAISNHDQVLKVMMKAQMSYPWVGLASIARERALFDCSVLFQIQFGTVTSSSWVSAMISKSSAPGAPRTVSTSPCGATINHLSPHESSLSDDDEHKYDSTTIALRSTGAVLAGQRRQNGFLRPRNRTKATCSRRY